MSNRLDYHEHLGKICERDVQYVREKDTQYDASWKRHGGAGAFFTIVRPWDRFYHMATGPAASGHEHDIFRIIRAQGLSGPDGSMIACVRDLRRYLLLLEAEMTEQLCAHKDAVTLGTITGQRGGELDKFLHGARPPGMAHLPEMHGNVDAVHATPSAGSQHASLTPWAAAQPWFDRHPECIVMRDRWWRQVVRGKWVLQSCIHGEPPPDEIRQLYRHYPDYDRWLLRILDCPDELRHWHPVLRREINSKEWSEMELWKQKLYNWNAIENKYVLDPAERAWSA